MAWICKDCGAELKPDIMAVGRSQSILPFPGWVGTKRVTKWHHSPSGSAHAVGWHRFASHQPCDERENEGEAEWVPIEELQARLRHAEKALEYIEHVGYTGALYVAGKALRGESWGLDDAPDGDDDEQRCPSTHPKGLRCRATIGHEGLHHSNDAGWSMFWADVLRDKDEEQ